MNAKYGLRVWFGHDFFFVGTELCRGRSFGGYVTGGGRGAGLLAVLAHSAKNSGCKGKRVLKRAFRVEFEPC